VKNKTGLNHEFTLKSLHSLVAVQKELTSFFDQANCYPPVEHYLSTEFNVLLIETGYAFKDALVVEDCNFDHLTKKINEFTEVPKKIIGLMNRSKITNRDEVKKDPGEETPSLVNPDILIDKRTNRRFEKSGGLITENVISKSYDYYNEITAPRSRVLCKIPLSTNVKKNFTERKRSTPKKNPIPPPKRNLSSKKHIIYAISVLYPTNPTA